MAGSARNGATHAADLARSKNEGRGSSVRTLRRSVSLAMAYWSTPNRASAAPSSRRIFCPLMLAQYSQSSVR